jgi:organic hydroperoxide reductase OsmC/OhrA
MSRHVATIRWGREPEAPFLDGRYSRAHRWRFDGGAEVAASSSPSVVRVPFSDPAGVDPEEALVAALSSCHMLFFLDFAAQAKFVVESYEDEAEGAMEKGADGRVRLTRATLRPLIRFAHGRAPSAEELAALHHQAHEACYIANSVTTQVIVEARAG